MIDDCYKMAIRGLRGHCRTLRLPTGMSVTCMWRLQCTFNPACSLKLFRGNHMVMSETSLLAIRACHLMLCEKIHTDFLHQRPKPLPPHQEVFRVHWPTESQGYSSSASRVGNVRRAGRIKLSLSSLFTDRKRYLQRHLSCHWPLVIVSRWAGNLGL